MLTKTLLVSVLIGIVAPEESFYSSRNCSESEISRAKSIKLPCVSKLEAYESMVGHVKNKFDQFYQQFDSEPLGLISREVLQQNRTEFERRISDVLHSFALDIQMLNMVKQHRLNHCRTSLERAATQIENLSNSMTALMKQITYELMNSNLPRMTIKNYRKPILMATRITIALDLSIKASQGLMKLGLWMEGEEFGSNSASNLSATQESIVAEFDLMLSKLLKEELGVANVGSEAAEAVQKGAAAVVEHLRSGNKAVEAVKEAERAHLLWTQANDEAEWLTETMSFGVSEDDVIAARKAQANRAMRIFSAEQAKRQALAMRVALASKIAETNEAAKTMSIAAETPKVATIEGDGVSEGAAVARAAVKGTIYAGTAVGIAGAAAMALNLMLPPAVGVVALINIAIVANQIAHDQFLKEHFDKTFANPLIEKKQFGIDTLNWLLVTINVQYY